jgi:hypothetical protein
MSLNRLDVLPDELILDVFELALPLICDAEHGFFTRDSLLGRRKGLIDRRAISPRLRNLLPPLTEYIVMSNIQFDRLVRVFKKDVQRGKRATGLITYGRVQGEKFNILDMIQFTPNLMTLMIPNDIPCQPIVLAALSHLTQLEIVKLGGFERKSNLVDDQVFA